FVVEVARLRADLGRLDAEPCGEALHETAAHARELGRVRDVPARLLERRADIDRLEGLGPLIARLLEREVQGRERREAGGRGDRRPSLWRRGRRDRPEQHRALDEVLQLADVAGERTLRERSEERLRELAFAAERAMEMRGE